MQLLVEAWVLDLQEWQAMGLSQSQKLAMEREVGDALPDPAPLEHLQSNSSLIDQDFFRISQTWRDTRSGVD